MTQYLKWKADPSKGEVFTPISLVSEMLDKIPDEVWRNPNTTFLDPCMGKGTFLLEIVRRLVYIYGYTEDDAKSRVYGYDIRVKYVGHLTRRGLKNVRHKDFLNEVINMKFDVVVGNPPFQDPNSPNNKSKLWTSFIQKGMDLTIENGYTYLICPDTWTSPSRETNVSEKLLKQFASKNLLLANFKTPNEHMNVGVNMSYFLLKNNNEYEGTKFITKKGEFMSRLPNDEFIPKVLDKNYMSILSKVISNPSKMTFKHYSSGVTSRVNFSETQEGEFTYPYFNTSGGLNNPSVFYGDSQDNKGLFGQRKIHTSGFGGYRIQLDNEGSFGSMHNGYCFLLGDIPATNHGVQSFFSLKIIKMILYPNLWHQFVEPKILSLLPLVDLTKIWNDKDFCEYLNLTNEEISYVESYVI